MYNLLCASISYEVYVQGDLTKPETIPATLVGVHTIIDCATGRPEEPIKTVSIITCIPICFHDYRIDFKTLTNTRYSSTFYMYVMSDLFNLLVHFR